MADKKIEASAKQAIGDFLSGISQGIAHTIAGTVPITLVNVNEQDLAIKFPNAAAMDDFIKNMPPIEWKQQIRTVKEHAIYIPVTSETGLWTLTFPNPAIAKAFCAICKFDETVQAKALETQVILFSLQLKASNQSQEIACTLNYSKPRRSYALTFPRHSPPEMNGMIMEPIILQNILYRAAKKEKWISFPFAQLVMYAQINKAFYHAAMAIYDEVWKIKLKDRQEYELVSRLRKHYIHQLGGSSSIRYSGDSLEAIQNSASASYLGSFAFKWMNPVKPKENSIAGEITLETIATQVSKLFGESRSKGIAPFPVVTIKEVEELSSKQHEKDAKSGKPALMLVLDFKDGRFATDLHYKLSPPT